MKLTKEYIRTVIREEVSNVLESQGNADMAKSATDALDSAPGLEQALDRVQDPATGSMVLSHFVNKLTAKGMDKSKLIKIMTGQYQAAKDADPSSVGKPAPTQPAE